MRAQRADRVAMFGIGIAIGDSDDDRPESPVVAALRRQHRRNQRVPYPIAQRQEDRHDPLHMRVQADVLLDEAPRRRLIALDRFFPLLTEEFLNGMPHDIGFDHRFRFRLEAEPSLAVRGVADVSHGSLRVCPKAGALRRTTQAPETVQTHAGNESL
jgi:hypothetical protein